MAGQKANSYLQNGKDLANSVLIVTLIRKTPEHSFSAQGDVHPAMDRGEVEAGFGDGLPKHEVDRAGQLKIRGRAEIW